MEHDLSNEKIFDMKIEIKGLSLLLPEYGIYKQFVHFLFSSFLIYLFYFLIAIVRQYLFISVILC